MPILFTILILIVALLLIGVVLVQNSKGGGLASNIGVSTQTMGVKKTADAIEKMTWYLVGALVVLCIASGYAFNGTKKGGGSGNFDPEIKSLEMNIPVNPNGPTGNTNNMGGGNQNPNTQPTQ